MIRLPRVLARVLAAALAASLVAQPVLAQSISTEQAAAAVVPAQEAAHARLQAALDRADLAAALRSRGVDLVQLRERVGALTDAEARQLVAQIDNAPAGADVLGLLFTVFVILLVTDILGFTKVFPFTRAVR
jgi:hypothetical protein